MRWFLPLLSACTWGAAPPEVEGPACPSWTTPDGGAPAWAAEAHQSLLAARARLASLEGAPDAELATTCRGLVDDLGALPPPLPPGVAPRKLSPPATAWQVHAGLSAWSCAVLAAPAAPSRATWARTGQRFLDTSYTPWTWAHPRCPTPPAPPLDDLRAVFEAYATGAPEQATEAAARLRRHPAPALPDDGPASTAARP
jgi:hypothetical protein